MFAFNHRLGALSTAAMLILLAVAAQAQDCTVQTPCALPAGIVGTPYSVTVFAVLGTPPYHDFTIASGSLPPGLSMTADAYGLTLISGTPTGAVGSPFTFVITFLDSNNSPSIPAQFSIAITNPTAPPSLNVAPGIVSFATQANSSGTLQQSLLVTNSGGGSIAFTASVASGSPWATISPTSGTVTAGSPVTITVTVSAQALKVSSNRDVIQVNSASGSASIPVTLFASGNGPILGVGETGVRFDILQGSGSSLSQTVPVVNTGTSSSTVNWTASLASIAGNTGPQFITLGTLNGQATASSPGALPLSLSGSVANLPEGAYYQLIELSDNNALNSPQYITAVLNVVAATGNPAPPPPPPVLSPAGLVFIGPVGQPIPAQQFTLNVSTAQFETYVTSPSLPAGQNWLQMTPANGSASLNTPAPIKVAVKTTGLGPGIYTGEAEVVVLLPTGSDVFVDVNVTLILTGSGGATPAAAPASMSSRTAVHPDANANGCTATSLILTETGLSNSFTVPAGWPANLIVNLNNDCGDPVGTGSVSASFSNGDPPLTLVTQGPSGQYSATWQPQNSGPGTIITLLGTASGLNPATAQITGGVAANQAPILNPNGIVNNATFLVGAALAPGMVAAAKGADLSTSVCPSPNTTCVSPSVPIPTALQGTQLIVGGRLAPLYYVSGAQVNAQIPAELTPNQQYAAVGIVNNQITLPVQVTVVPIAPAVIQFQDASLIAQHGADYSLVTPTSPAHPGEHIIMYLVGMGATNPVVLSGAAAPSTAPLAAAVVQPTLTVGTLNALIYFAGLTPGAVGLYQIDFQVPPNATAGNFPVVVQQGDITANITTLPVAVP
jgi:uncharacterized protein (TIGR03437 family)